MIYVSIFAYAFGKQDHSAIGGLEVAKNLAIESGEGSSIAAFRTLARLVKLCESRGEQVMFALEVSTLIAKARCVMAGAFLRSPCDLWITIDDDVDASIEALDLLLSFATARDRTNEQNPRIVIGAMKTRANDKFNIGLVGVDGKAGGDITLRTNVMYRVTHGGMALAAIPRAALDRVIEKINREYHEELTDTPPSFIEDENPCPTVFTETIVGGLATRGRFSWCGEDVSFCHRAHRAGVPIFGFIHPGIVHAGIPSVP